MSDKGLKVFFQILNIIEYVAILYILRKKIDVSNLFQHKNQAFYADLDFQMQLAKMITFYARV